MLQSSGDGLGLYLWLKFGAVERRFYAGGSDVDCVRAMYGREAMSAVPQLIPFPGRSAEREERLTRMVVTLYVESVGGRQVAVQEFRASQDFPVLEYQVRGQTKVARNEAVSPLAESGKVWLPSPVRAPWVIAYVEELVGFPELAHDDRCDATAMALQVLRVRVEPVGVIIPPVSQVRAGYA